MPTQGHRSAVSGKGSKGSLASGTAAGSRASAGLAGELRARGMRATGPRLLILEHLRAVVSHPTPEQVHAALRRRHPGLSLSTVYETLESFLHVGLCRRVAGSSGRLRVDGTRDDHDHAVCLGCGAILDLERAPRRPAAPRGLPRGTEVLGHRIEYDVLCPRCTRDRSGRRPAALGGAALVDQARRTYRNDRRSGIRRTADGVSRRGRSRRKGRSRQRGFDQSSSAWPGSS